MRHWMKSFGLACLVLPGAACQDGEGGGGSATPVPIVVTNMAEYTAACEQALGEIPAFDCSEATELPIRVTDPVTSIVTTVSSASQLEDGANCDSPFYIGGCVPHTRLGVKTNSQGSTFAFICRAYEFRPAGAVLFDDLGLIGHDPESGAACFWAVPIDGTTFDGSSIPRPGSAEDLSFFAERPFWYTLNGLAGAGCMSCHDNDPYIHTPIVDAPGILPGHPLAPFVPIASDVLNARGSTNLWSRAKVLVHPDAAQCTQCHRLSNRFTCELAMDAAGDKITATSAHFRSYPRSHWMDDFDPAVLAGRFASETDWDAHYGTAVQTIRDCCNAPGSSECWATPE